MTIRVSDGFESVFVELEIATQIIHLFLSLSKNCLSLFDDEQLWIGQI
jgi:hypothetical protein